jgi:hypothetical protein
MPKIPNQYIKSIVNLLREGRPIGTAFVGRLGEIDDAFYETYYLITCEHCIEKSVLARFSNGQSISIDQRQWCKSPTGDDVVAFDITDMVLRAQGDIGYIDIGNAVGRMDSNFGIGSDLYMLGLSLDERDIGENVPRARFGNLSAFANDRVLIRQGNNAERPCHLGDMRSRTGFSGSPVIGYMEMPALDARENYKYGLFGIHSAQHGERISLFTESDAKAVEIPSSMTRIVPAWKIEELLEHPTLVAQREARKRSTA